MLPTNPKTVTNKSKNGSPTNPKKSLRNPKNFTEKSISPPCGQSCLPTPPRDIAIQIFVTHVHMQELRILIVGLNHNSIFTTGQMFSISYWLSLHITGCTLRRCRRIELSYMVTFVSVEIRQTLHLLYLTC